MNTWQISAADPLPQRNKKKTTGVDEVIEDMKIEGKLRGRVWGIPMTNVRRTSSKQLQKLTPGSLEENWPCVELRAAIGGEVDFYMEGKCLLFLRLVFGDKEIKDNWKRTYISIPHFKTIISLSLQAVWNLNPTLCLAFSVPARPICAHLTTYFPRTQHILVTWWFTIPEPTLSLPSSWLCFHSSFHPSKSWLSSGPKPNTMLSRNKAFSDSPCQHQPLHIPAGFWTFLYIGSWDHPLFISYMFTWLSPSKDHGFSNTRQSHWDRWPQTNQTTL